MNLNSNSYIKEIEWFYLRLKGKGVMLSSRDYNLISEWYKNSIPQDVILDAIRQSLNKCNFDRVNAISDIKDDINDYIKINYLSNKNYECSIEEQNKIIYYLLERIDNILNKIQNNGVIKGFMLLRENLIEMKKSNNSNFLLILKDYEEDLYSKFYELLPKKTKKDILDKAKEMMPKESKYYDDITKERTINSFKKDLILNELQLINIFDLSDL